MHVQMLPLRLLLSPGFSHCLVDGTTYQHLGAPAIENEMGLTHPFDSRECIAQQTFRLIDYLICGAVQDGCVCFASGHASELDELRENGTQQ